MTSIDLFIESIKSPATRVTYKQSLNQFREATGFKLTDNGKTKGKLLREKIIEYVIQLKKSGASYSRINVIVSAMQAYCDAYDIDVNFDKVRRYTPEHVRKVKDRAYTKEEIRTLLEAANTRVRMLILLFVSTGMREGAVPGLKLKHLTKMQDGCYKISLYDEDVSKRVTVFTTTECSQAIDAYLKYREVEGEVLKPESTLIRKEFSWRDANRFEPVSRNTIARLIEEVTLRTGLRIKSGGKRQEVMLVHGLRKYYDTNLARANIKTLFIPILMGHSSPGLQSSYFRPTEEEIYTEYKKAADLLTISEEKHLRYEVEKLKTEVADVDLMKKNYLDMKLEIEKRDRQIQDLYEVLYQQGIIKKGPSANNQA